MDQKKKRYVIIGVSLALVGGAVWYIYNEHKNQKTQTAAPDPAQAPPAPSDTTTKPAVTSPPNATNWPLKTKGKSTGAVKSPVDAPIKPVSVDSILAQKGENAIIGKTLYAKSNGAGIYNTTNQKVSVTNAGEKLGKAFLAKRMQAGNYLIKYQDNVGNYRVIASSSVNAM